MSAWTWCLRLVLGAILTSGAMLAVPARALETPPAYEHATRASERQVAAWNHGDLEGALAAYRGDAEVTWVSRAGVSRGFHDFAAEMRRAFPDPAGMGTYAAQVLDARSLGPRAALLVVRWSIVRDGRRLMGGVSTQLWRATPTGWRIALEHAS